MTNINPFKIIMKVRTAMWYLFFLTIGVWLLSSCEQKDLCYDHNHASNVKVTFDWEQYPNANPASMCFYLFPREEGERTLKREFIGKNGGIAQALVGVSYTALGFNSDTRNTSFRYNISTNSIEASSKDAGTIDRIGISASLLPRAKGTEGERMSMEVDSIYSSASEKDILISLEENDRGDTCKITLSPKRRFCTYRLKIMNIDNQQNLSSPYAISPEHPYCGKPLHIPPAVFHISLLHNNHCTSRPAYPLPAALPFHKQPALCKSFPIHCPYSFQPIASCFFYLPVSLFPLHSLPSTLSQ